MMKKLLVLTTCLFLLFFMSCTSENRDNARAYVEGTITGNEIDFSEVKVVIKSDSKNVAETIPNTNGQFKLSGPLLSDSFSLVLSKKIKTFSASKEGCSLSTDSLEITIPIGTTYITFNEINLE